MTNRTDVRAKTSAWGYPQRRLGALKGSHESGPITCAPSKVCPAMDNPQALVLRANINEMRHVNLTKEASSGN